MNVYPVFCYYCGVIGHLVKDCIELGSATGEVPEELLMFGDWLRTSFSTQQPKHVNGSLQRSRGQQQDQRVTIAPGNVMRPEDYSSGQWSGDRGP